MDLKSIKLMKDCLPNNMLEEKGVIEPEKNDDNGENKKTFAFVVLNDHNQEEQIRELRKEYPSTDNSITMLIDQDGNILRTFGKESDDDRNEATNS